MKTKALLYFGVVFGLAPMMLIGWYWWDSHENHGLNFGYWRVFNRLQHALSSIPGLTITHEWANDDVTLEEFGFDITTNREKKVAIGFDEEDPIRGLSSELLTRALTNKIQAEAAFGRAGEFLHGSEVWRYGN